MKNTLDCYFSKLELKSIEGTEDVVLLGYFDSPAEFKQMIEKLGKMVKHKSTLDYFIQTLPSKKPLIEGLTLEIDEAGVVKVNSNYFDLKSEEGVTQFVKRHFNVASLRFPRHYWAELSLQFDTMAETPVIVGYFSAINEFFEILAEAGSRINDAGNLAFQIQDGSTGHMISSRIYKIQANADVCIPENPPYFFNLRKEEDIQKFCLFLWEADFTE